MKTNSLAYFFSMFLTFTGLPHTPLSTQIISRKSEGSRTPVTIFYGLNESHSRSWAQCTKDGLAGISYFRLDSNNANNEGCLIYRTIQTDNTVIEDTVTIGTRMEISVLLFDSLSNPHIFVASSDTNDQIIQHYFKNDNNVWIGETIIHFFGEGGKHIYELSADNGPNNSFHLLALKTRSNPDSDDYYYAFINAHLYHITNSNGVWQKELIHNYDTFWTMDEYVKSANRQDIKVDNDGFIHVVFGEQINGLSNYSPSRLCYSTNRSGDWVIETAADYLPGRRDDGGWFPSLCLDNNGRPNISCTYIGRFSSGSATHAKLLFVYQISHGVWENETVATGDDGYYGSDGRDYTGGLTHLVFDKYNTPRIIFSDIASSHAGMNYFNLGNIRYAVKINNSWNISTIYRQPLPNGFFNATEMYAMCLLIAENTDKIQVVGQQLVVNSSTDYHVTLVHTVIDNSAGIKESSDGFVFLQNFPNPFNPRTSIQYQIPAAAHVTIKIYNLLGQEVATILSQRQTAGNYAINWNGKTSNGSQSSSGTYVYRMVAKSADKTYVLSKKMLLLK